MSDDNDHERIARKAHEIWESEGHPHGRDQAHWDQAKEIIALHDSLGDTLLPRDTGAGEPEEPALAVENNGDIPGLTDQGRDDLVDTDREPEITKPSHATHALGDTAGHVARPGRDAAPDIDDSETVTPAPKVAAVTPTPSNPTLGEPAPRDAGQASADVAAPQTIAPKGAPAAAQPKAAASGSDKAPVRNGTAPSGTAKPATAAPASGITPGGTGKPAPKPAIKPPTPPAKGKPHGKR